MRFVSKPEFRIAVVDDDPKITKLLSVLLEDKLNCDVEVFNDPVDALALFREKKFDVISLDYQMPKMSGMDIVKLLRSSEGPNKNTKIILLTEFSDEAEICALNLLDHITFLDKPIIEESYLRWIKIILMSNKTATTTNGNDR